MAGHLMTEKKVVAIGGGTGLANLLRTLKSLTPNLTAVVAMTDNGGSSGRLRRDFGMLPPGDIRNCLLALSSTEPDVERLLSYRFPLEGTLSGHTVGNILLAAIMQSEGVDIAEATARLSQILAITGRVLPATCDNVSLGAILADESELLGEAEIAADHREIKRLFLQGEEQRPNIEAIRAIEEADYIFIGPGSIYSSLISNLLLSGMASSLYRSRAKVCFLSNMATEPAELRSDKLSVAYGLIEDYFRRQMGLADGQASEGEDRLVDVIIANSGAYPADILAKLGEHNSRPIVCDMEAEPGADRPRLIKGDFVDEANPWQHSREKLVPVLAALLKE